MRYALIITVAAAVSACQGVFSYPTASLNGFEQARLTRWITESKGEVIGGNATKAADKQALVAIEPTDEHPFSAIAAAFRNGILTGGYGQSQSSRSGRAPVRALYLCREISPDAHCAIVYYNGWVK